MSRSLLHVALALGVLSAGCASRGAVRSLRDEVSAVGAGVGALQAQQQVVVTTEEALGAELKTLSAEVLALETRVADAVVQLSRLDTRLAESEKTTREASASITALHATVDRLSAAPPPPPVATPPAPAPATPAPGAEQAYAAALGTFRAREHGQAVLDFLDFLVKYPKHPLAPNAQYWIGEAYYVQHDYRQAIVEFEKVLEHGLANPKVPDALLKVGFCFRNLRNSERAGDVWRRVVREYPRSDAASKARAVLRGGR